MKIASLLMRILSSKKMVGALAKRELTPRSIAYYMLLGTIFNLIVGYSTLTGSNASRTWLGLYECAILSVLTIYGFERCYAAADGENCGSFVTDFVCLSIPIGISTLFFTWLGYWIFWTAFGYVVREVSFGSESSAHAMLLLNAQLPWFSVFVAMLASTFLFHWRLSVHLGHLRRLREG
jgi:hypothetical protein